MTDDAQATEAATEPAGKAKARRARPEPPILDLAAQEVKSDSADNPSDPGAEGPAPSASLSRLQGLRPIVAALAAGAIGGAMVVTAFYVLTPPAGPSDQLAALENRIETLAAKANVAALEQRVAKVENLSAETYRQFSQLATRPSDSAALDKRMSTVEGVLAQMSQQILTKNAASGDPAARLVLAALIRDRVEQGVPFARELEALTVLAGTLPGQDHLKPWASEGVASYAVLRVELAESLRPAKPAVPVPDAAAPDWGNRFLKVLSHLITITPSDQAPFGASSAWQDLESALVAGDGAKAQAILQALPASQHEIVKQWGARLEARLSAQQAANELFNAALDALKMKGSAP